VPPKSPPAYIINEVKARGARYSQPTIEGEAEWVATTRSLAVIDLSESKALFSFAAYNRTSLIQARYKGVARMRYPIVDVQIQSAS
jgi:hypothetical protein